MPENPGLSCRPDYLSLLIISDIRFAITTPQNFYEHNPGDDQSANRFTNVTLDNFFEVYKVDDPSEAGSSIGTLQSLPTFATAGAALERFEDYGYSESTPSVSRHASLSKVPTTTTKSVASLSTGASLARRFDSTLGSSLRQTSNVDSASKSMFDQAFLHTRDLQ